MKDFYVSKNEQHKLRVTISTCEFPKSLKNIQFINEFYDDKGNLTDTSTYQFFLTERAIIHLSKELLRS